jgi:hypothetical protein
MSMLLLISLVSIVPIISTCSISIKHRIEIDGLYLTKERRLRMARAAYDKGAPLEGRLDFID